MANSTFGFVWFARTTGVSLAAVMIAWGCGGTGNSNATGGASGRGGSGSGATGGSSTGGSSATGGSSTGGSSTGGSSTGGSGGSIVTTGGTGTGGTGLEAGAPNGGSGNELCADCACSNGLDDDGDGLVDGFDPECTGPLDDDEGSYATGIPGDNVDPKWQDCFFDGNSGAGDDGCRYHTDCLTGDKPQDDPACEVAQACVDFCAPRTTNGCDCFGCCSVTTPDGVVDIFTKSSCSLDKIDDETACPRCVKSTLCGNDCGECELCPGKTEADLPESCKMDPPDGGTPTDGGDPPVYVCESGQQVCSPEIPCPTNYYCSLGCCVDVSVR